MKERRFPYAGYALDVIIPIKGSRWQWYISFIIGLSIAFAIGFSQETVILFDDAVNIFNNLFVAFIAMEMGAYALFQALLSKKLILELHNIGKKLDRNMLDDSNSSFLGMILLFWFGIIINVVIIIILKIIPDNWLVSNNMLVNNILASLLMTLYFCFCLRVLFEVRNFAINLYMVFTASNKTDLLEALEEDKNT